MQSGDIEYSEPVCISGIDGAKGDKGSTGTGVRGIVEQYYLSTSSTAQSGGSWSEAQPAWAKGKYIWTRSKDRVDGRLRSPPPSAVSSPRLIVTRPNQMARQRHRGARVFRPQAV
ncbi:MAG: hypothetical protein ACLTHL_07305 [Collinsella sp.]